jgi:lipopolysaccharide/colanic/teichoic acid biosynthesis glycosyltransferase
MVVKPGITGLAQVRGFRGEIISPDAIRHRLQSDIEYLENWRLTLDIVIIARTAVQMLFPPPTAY